MSSEFEIISIKPDTIVFPFAKVITRRIPVRQEVSYTLDQQLILKAPVLLYPDSVEVTGPDYLLDTLSFIRTRRRDLGIISKNREFDLALQVPRHITLRRDEVSIRFEVEKFTEKLLSIPVRIQDAPDSLKLITFPGTISLSCQVGLSNYEKLQAEMFSAVVQYSDIAEGQTRLKIRLEKIPEFVTEVSYSPNNVEYLIER
jgi:YbbR domain-containing protein